MKQGTSCTTYIPRDKVIARTCDIRLDFQAMSQYDFVRMLWNINGSMRMKNFLNSYNITIDRERIYSFDKLADHLLKIVYGENAITYKEYQEEIERRFNALLNGNL